MQKRRKGKVFGRETKQRKALMRGLAVALIKHGRIKTTEIKAKALRPYVEKLITKGKINNLSTVKNISAKYADRKGGYTRIKKMAQRTSDGARMAIIEFV